MEILHPIFQHKKSKLLYQSLGNQKFQNLITGAEGTLDDDTANKVFLFCPDLSDCIQSHPLVKDLIKKLELTLK